MHPQITVQFNFHDNITLINENILLKTDTINVQQNSISTYQISIRMPLKVHVMRLEFLTNAHNKNAIK